MDRRAFLAALGLGAAGLACARRGPVLPDPFTGLADELRGATPDLNVFLGGGEFLAARDQRVPLGLLDADGVALAGGEPRVWIGAGRDAAGPFPARYLTYRDPSPADAKGFYLAHLPFPEETLVTVLVEHDNRWGSAVTRARRRPHVPGEGQRAPRVATPTFGAARGVASICTRDPVCPMHDVRLDRALAGGRPVVFTLSSPKFCTSRTCGPVVDEVLSVRAAFGREAAFVHAEVFADQPPVLSPTAEAWSLESEPWTVVVDAAGRIAARFEGPVTAGEIEEALAALV